MKKLLLFVSVLFIILNCIAADTISVKRPSYIAVNSNHGTVFQTSSYVAGEYRIPYYTSGSVKYGFGAKGDNWKDYVFKMPYVGVGIYFVDFFRKSDFGSPMSVFIFQGAHLTNIHRKISLNYEWNLGLSFNWRYYDPVDNPMNTVIGTPLNVHVSGNLHMKWRISSKFNLDFGVGLAHFSNGASHYPNYGLNLLSVFTELSYHFNRQNNTPEPNKYPAPEFKKRKEHEVMFLISSRHAKLDTTGTNLKSIYAPKHFKVLGISYSYLIHNLYRYKWGPSLDFVYDESSGFKAWRELNSDSGIMEEKIEMGELKDRLSLGLSLKGEILMPHYSIFANFGYNVIHGNKKDNRFYQIVAIKINFTDNFFGTFGIRARRFSRATYLFTNLGFTIPQCKG
ncbi:MAG: hypothetical protein LBQ22_12495 [Bacteroidales bacterium]|jgi:hypothetical protein|nr:hypothetical protein [Bacteroidales bacterium]